MVWAPEASRQLPEGVLHVQLGPLTQQHHCLALAIVPVRHAELQGASLVSLRDSQDLPAGLAAEYFGAPCTALPKGQVFSKLGLVEEACSIKLSIVGTIALCPAAIRQGSGLSRFQG